MDGSDGCASLAYGNEGFVSDAFQQTEIPNLIDDIVKEGGKGVANGKGFYDYEPGESRCGRKPLLNSLMRSEN
jgi:3-hydroxyacyl-CoA dehydrogenase